MVKSPPAWLAKEELQNSKPHSHRNLLAFEVLRVSESLPKIYKRTDFRMRTDRRTNAYSGMEQIVRSRKIPQKQKKQTNFDRGWTVGQFTTVRERVKITGLIWDNVAISFNGAVHYGVSG